MIMVVMMMILLISINNSKFHSGPSLNAWVFREIRQRDNYAAEFGSGIGQRENRSCQFGKVISLLSGDGRTDGRHYENIYKDLFCDTP